MKVHRLSETNSVLNTFLFEIRDLNIQNDTMRFRRNIQRIGEILGYEMSKSLQYEPKKSLTPLGEKYIPLSNNNIVICSILRAGIPLQLGVLNYFDRAESAFISAYRKHDPVGDGFTIEVEYIACPDLNEKILILVDPMLATGQSIALTYEALKKYGEPKELHVLSVIGSTIGIDHLQSKLPSQSQLWIGDIDPQLNDKGYIVPGLGDAGDLAFGQKLQN